MAKKRSFSISRAWQYVGLAVVGAVVLGLSVAALQPRTPTVTAQDRPALTAEDFAEPTPTSAAPVTVGVLSDSHAYNEGSWWRQAVVAGTVPGVVLGAFESQPGATAGALIGRLDAATAPGGIVLVQAGTNDLLSAVTPADALARVEALWDGVAARGATPVAVLLPPSATRPAETVELNALITDAATARGLTVIDVYSGVATADGAWAAGMSDDGVHANAGGSAVMTEAARAQLVALVP